MTNERRQDAIIVALVLSAAAHFGLMYYAKTQVMTEIARGKNETERPVAMQVVKRTETVTQAKIEELMDLKAAKEAPAADRIEVPEIEREVAVPETEKVAPSVKDFAATAPEAAAEVFEAKVADAADDKHSELPVLAIETPMALMTAAAVVPELDRTTTATLPKSAAAGAAAAAAAATPALPEIAPAPVEKISRATEEKVKERAKEEFKPSETVYEKVDEQVVESEKAAVKSLIDQEGAEELVKFVNVALVRETDGEWEYFNVMITPRVSLPTVPKDVVVLIDASGSIGKDRMGSIREAAKKILRSATNSGDRFNFVAFRDKFSYAFRTWQECTQSSFDATEKWIGNLAAHGRTDVFSTISSVLTLPRDPKRPLIALVVTDGDANMGVRDTASILSKFTALNGGLISVYMYGVKSSANRELIDVLTRGNRGESFIFDGWRWKAGSGIESLSDRFRDPVLTDLRLLFAATSPAETYPRHLRNLYRGGTLEIAGRVRKGTEAVSFSLRGLNGATAYEGFFRLPLASSPVREGLKDAWSAERAIDQKLK